MRERTVETLITAIIKLVTEGGPAALGGLGWLLYLLERYYFSPKREAEFRADLNSFREDYKTLGEKMTETLNRFTVILEVVKDRMRGKDD